MDSDLIATRMRQVMQASGLSQREFAARIASTEDKLSKSLSGRRKFTTTELALAAEAAGTSVDWLLRGEHRASPAIAARTALPSPPAVDEISAAIGRFSDASEQLDLLRETPRVLTAPPRLAINASYVVQGGQLANDATKMVGAAGRSVVTDYDLAALIEDVFAIDVAFTELPGNLDGCSWQTTAQRIIMAARTPYWARQRFTLAHELGHILALDAQNLIAENVREHRSQLTEKRANTFAASFLMPENDVIDRSAILSSPGGFSHMVSEFRVSPISMAWRLYNLGIIPMEEVSKWNDLTSEACALKAGKPDLVRTERGRADTDRIPPRLFEDHLQYFHQGETSARPLAHLLGIESAEVIELFRMNGAPRS